MMRPASSGQSARESASPPTTRPSPPSVAWERQASYRFGDYTQWIKFAGGPTSSTLRLIVFPQDEWVVAPGYEDANFKARMEIQVKDEAQAKLVRYRLRP